MEQRSLRLGDIVDDYCPRERRVTNHAVVAIVEDVIRQTRCTACDAEHPFKGGREPRLRKKPAAPGAEDRALAARADGSPGLPDETPVAADSSVGDRRVSEVAGSPSDERAAADAEAPAQTPDERADAWLAHRQLIRATLPKTDNDPPPPRPIPEFTMHQRPAARGGRSFRFYGGGGGNAHGNGNGNVDGNVNGNGPARGGFGQGRPGKHGGRRHRNRRPR